MATTTRRKTPAKKTTGTKTAAAPAAEPRPAAEPTTATGARTDVSSTGHGTESPVAGSADRHAGPPRAAEADDPALREAIARRAYEIYEASGRPEGRDAEHWAQAEAEVRAARAGR